LQSAPVFGRLFGRKRRAAVDKANDLLNAIGLYHARSKYPAQLSGGMQQRLSIAQSVICEPKILLLDEPFGALDRHHRRHARTDSQTVASWRMTIFMITHDVQESFKLGTRLMVFDKLVRTHRCLKPMAPA
jgi:NitT/TauT family transport system ATP-binding protein